MAKTDKITQERLKQLLNYDRCTGIFTWKDSRGGTVCIGDVAGAPSGKGYILITIDDVLYKAHRLAFLYEHGYIPYRVDHRNRNRSDNSIENLRSATPSQNVANSSISKNNTSGYKGVHYDKKKNRWRANICVNGVRIRTKRYLTPEDARDAYDELANKHFGEFASLQ
jgi:hypothetical protein